VDRSSIGASLGIVTFPVERGKVREFAAAIMDDNPAYQDEKGAPIPPTFTMTQQLWPTTFDGAPPDLSLDFSMVLHGEQEFEYLAPVNAGDVLTGETKIADVYTKEGKRGGTLTFVILETRYANQDGREVIVARNTIIETSQAATGGG
jgi:hydroxyacyl-ACP dehydratase HTD2-like protein with hotdog domain